MDDVTVFPILPASARTLWIAGGIAAAVGLIALAIGAIPMLARNARCEVKPEGLDIHAIWYGRTIPYEELRLEEGRAVDLGREPELRPRWRTNGIGLPGYQSGWFKLQDERKALLFVTDPTSVLLLPTTNDWSVLVSVAAPEALLEALRRASTAS